MAHKIPARKKLNPKTKQRVGQIAALLDRRVKSAKKDSLSQEAKRLYAKYPFKYDPDKSCVPMKAQTAMAHFLIARSAQKHLSKAEFSDLARIINMHEQGIGWRSQQKEMDKIGRKNLLEMLKKFDELELDAWPTRVLAETVVFAYCEEGQELHHIVKFGSDRAVTLLGLIKSLMKEYLGLKPH